MRKTHRTELQNQKAKRRESICWERKSVMGSKRCAFEDPSERFGEKRRKKRRRSSLSFGNKKKKKLDLLNAFFFFFRERKRRERKRESETVWCSIHSNIKGRTLGLSNPIG